MLLYILERWYPCRSHQECAEQARLFHEQMLVALLFGQQQLRELLGYRPHSITASDQTVEQIAAAGFSYREVVEVVRQGEYRDNLIEWTEGVTNRADFIISEYGSTILVMKGEVGERPIHVACGFSPQPGQGRCWDLRVLFAYDPSGHAYRGKWGSDYSTRTCFCSPESFEVRVPVRLPSRRRPSALGARRAYTTGDSR